MISRVASLTSSSRPAGDDRRPSITSESDWRVRIDAGTLFAMGCLLAGAGSLRRRFAKPQQGCTPTKFSSKLRTSPDLQKDALEKAGCTKIFTDTASGAKAERIGLDEALDYARVGDTLVVWRLDRLGRSLYQDK